MKKQGIAKSDRPAKPENEEAQTPEGRITPFTITPPVEMVNKAIRLIGKSSRPVFVVGHGAKFSMGSIIKLAESMNAPVITTFK